MIKYLYKTVLLFYFIFTVNIYNNTLKAQSILDSIPIEQMTKENISLLTDEDLVTLSLIDLKTLVKKFKLSSIQELYDLILNPEIKTASKIEEENFNSPLSTTVITAKEIEESGAICIPEALRLSTGLIVRQKTNGNYDVHIRGNDNVPPGKYLFDSENTMTLVMIDNCPVYNHFQ